MAETDIVAAVNATAQARIRAFVQRIEILKDEQKRCEQDIGEVYAEAKGEGFNVAALKRLVAKRSKDPAQRAEEAQMDALYEGAIEDDA